jgi:hypothetical protein
MIGAAAAFLKFSRDKRGYEHFYLVQPTTNRRGKTRTRILYWFRTPPGVRVGRLPFDADVQRAIEAQNPGVTFDWKRLLATPIPPPSADVERWRERRRVERAEKAARRALRSVDPEVEAEIEPDAHPGSDESDIDPFESEGSGSEVAPLAAASGPVLEAEPESTLQDRVETVEAVEAVQPVAAGPEQASRKRRRRRRGGRHNKRPTEGGPPSSNGVA